MYRLSEPLSCLIDARLVDAGDRGEPLPWTIEDMCSECGTYCDYVGHFHTPPQSPSIQGFSNVTDLDVSLYASATQAQSTNYADTPYYPHAPPSTPVNAQSEHPIQFWSSDIYKATINFPPSELPEHLRDGAWCHMPAQAELAILFGPEAATPFSWTPTGTIQSPGDDDSSLPTIGAGFPKFFWGPLQLEVDSTSSSATQTLRHQRGPPPCVELQSLDKTMKITANNSPDSEVETQVLDSNEVEAQN